MKKNILFPFVLLLAFATAACNENAGAATPEQPAQEEETPSDDNNDETNENDENANDGTRSRCLVVYCSRTGNTERMAQTIQSALNCDLLEVVPETPYDDNYSAMLERAQTELAAIGQGNYPAISTSVGSFEEYDLIFVGYPIWYSHIATPMQTFLHNHAHLLAGKQIALFASSGSSGISTSEADARALVPEAAFTESLLLTSNTLTNMEARIQNWLESIGAISGSNNDTAPANSIRLTINNETVLTATLADNSSAQALLELLAQGDITINMSDYASMEKVGPLGATLPRNDERINTTAGDLILYLGSYFVIYYDTNSYSLTRLGKIDNIQADELRAILGAGDVQVRLSVEK